MNREELPNVNYFKWKEKTKGLFHIIEWKMFWDSIEEKDKEIERLNNIINELEETLEYDKNDYGENIDIETHNIDSEFLRGNAWEADYILEKLKELKDKNE